MILALDFGLNLGWAAGSPKASFTSGVAVFSSTGQHIGRMLYQAETWFDERMEEFSPDMVVAEAPIHVPTNDLQSLEIQYTLGGMVALNCMRRGIVYKRQPMGKVRAATIGFTRAPNTVPRGRTREWMKAQIVAYCIARGWAPQSDHAADALLNLEYALAQNYPEYGGFHPGPLFIEDTKQQKNGD